MNHLTDIKSLSIDDINKICNRAIEFEKQMRRSNHTNKHIINIFFENSTRTKLSFEMAESRTYGHPPGLSVCADDDRDEGPATNQSAVRQRKHC